MSDLPKDVYWVTGLRAKGWLFANIGPMKLALARRAYWGVKVYKQDLNHAAVWHDVTSEFLDDHGRKKW